ncbi:uncharacterized protein N7482_010301 [Penicillium canariense]|uniref:Uncharacterized protein n=1 Tax=Penicillium canariense TaxID=189055 RepID=A0A9W9HNV7_9EURO|nr:uncharacterized protein N7482_010301 [Penicillium canariense]KAJ5151049.1 hypothetical protein N7482_010301 [Penicillium canariense]
MATRSAADIGRDGDTGEAPLAAPQVEGGSKHLPAFGTGYLVEWDIGLCLGTWAPGFDVRTCGIHPSRLAAILSDSIFFTLNPCPLISQKAGQETFQPIPQRRSSGKRRQLLSSPSRLFTTFLTEIQIRPTIPSGWTSHTSAVKPVLRPSKRHISTQTAGLDKRTPYAGKLRGERSLPSQQACNVPHMVASDSVHAGKY